jgi:hypothetical protein
MMVQRLGSELSVLREAVKYPNLTAAANHVGLSQSQLSRIVKKIEDELGIALLERSSKRASGWTNQALRLARVFELQARNFEVAILEAVNEQTLARVRFGLLEGLLPLFKIWLENWVQRPQVPFRELQVNSLELAELETEFLLGHLDVALTSRPPGRGKTQFVETLGYQSMQARGAGLVMAQSPFEAKQVREPNFGHKESNLLVTSNSLWLRRSLIDSGVAKGMLPSVEVRPRSSREFATPVYMACHSGLPERLRTDILLNFKQIVASGHLS